MACLQPCPDEGPRLSTAHFLAGPRLLGVAFGTFCTDCTFDKLQLCLQDPVWWELLFGQSTLTVPLTSCSCACRTPWSTHGGEPSFSSSSRVTLLAPEQDLREAELTVKPLMVAYSNFEMELGCKFPFSSLQLVR